MAGEQKKKVESIFASRDGVFDLRQLGLGLSDSDDTIQDDDSKSHLQMHSIG